MGVGHGRRWRGGSQMKRDPPDPETLDLQVGTPISPISDVKMKLKYAVTSI